ncbi:MAG: hypothetical protein ACOCP4_05215 [Candidatus Woesearchaeota archaeon]
MNPSQSRTLIDKNDIRIAQAKLATEIGLNENIFLQQVHYWIKGNEERNKNYKDGRYWTYNSYPDWKKKSFPFWSISTIRRTVVSLEKQGLITTTSKYNKKEYDNTKWYTINYDKLKAVTDKAYNIKPQSHPLEQGPVQNEQGGVQNEQGSVQNEQTNTKDFTKINNNNNKGDFISKNSELVDNFNKAFDKDPNSFQIEKLEYFMLSGLDKNLINKTLRHCALGGHNQNFFFNRLSMLLDDGIFTVQDLNEKISSISKHTNKNNNDQTENKNSEDDYKYKDFFIDFEKYKE